MLTNTLRTVLPSRSTFSTKKTRSALLDSMKRPGATRLTSSRWAKRCRLSVIWPLAQGVTTVDSTATSRTPGRAKRSTGRSQAVRLWPLANQTTISESR